MAAEFTVPLTYAGSPTKRHYRVVLPVGIRFVPAVAYRRTGGKVVFLDADGQVVVTYTEVEVQDIRRVDGH